MGKNGPMHIGRKIELRMILPGRKAFIHARLPVGMFIHLRYVSEHFRLRNLS